MTLLAAAKVCAVTATHMWLLGDRLAAVTIGVVGACPGGLASPGPTTMLRSPTRRRRCVRCGEVRWAAGRASRPSVRQCPSQSTARLSEVVVATEFQTQPRQPITSPPFVDDVCCCGRSASPVTAKPTWALSLATDGRLVRDLLPLQGRNRLSHNRLAQALLSGQCESVSVLGARVAMGPSVARSWPISSVRSSRSWFW